MIDIFLISLGFLLILIGIIGGFIPVMPGPPFSYAGMIIIHLTSKASFQPSILIIMGVLAFFATLTDYVLPVLGTRTTGGSRHGIFGATIGLIIGIFFFPPFGIILGPLLGAFLAEIMNKQPSTIAIKSAIGSFIGLMLGIVFKLIVSSLIAWFAFKNLFLI